MKTTSVVKGLLKCPLHETYYIKCHCPVPVA